MKKIAVIFVAMAMAIAAMATPLDSLGIDGEESTSLGIYIKEIATGRVLAEHNSQMALIPASVMKSITTASVLSLKGGDSRFATRVALRGTRGADSVWHGDIVVHSSADPTLESEYFRSSNGFCDSIVANLRRMGINRLTGVVVVREGLKDAGPILQWELEDLAWPYGAGLFGFNWRDNIVTVYPNTGRITPEAPGLTLDVRPSTKGNDFIRGIYSNHLVIYRKNTKENWAVKVSVPEPAAVFGAEIKSKFEANGIAIGQTSASADTEEETTLYTHYSPTYSDIMHSLMVRSDNLFAEGMLRTLAPEGSRKDAIEREKQLWESRGISPRYTIIKDGSGLTVGNRLSTRFLADVLEYMAVNAQDTIYTGFFPRAGKEGTMRGMLEDSNLEGKIALKTGSVSSVQCYVGYKLDDNDRPTHVIAIMVNGFFCKRSEVRKATETLLERLFLPEDQRMRETPSRQGRRRTRR